MTHCPYCALQCSMSVIDGQVAPGPGGLCQKGWTAGELLRHPSRLTTPLVNGKPASWDEALDYVVARIRECEPDEVAVFGGGGLTNEKAYLLGKFARVALKTSQIDYNGRFCMSSAAAAGNRAFGLDRGMPFPLSDLKTADTVLLAGSNPAETMPPFLRHLDGARLIVIDPRRTATAERATLHLQPVPGTDLALALGLLHTAVIEGVIDKEYVSERTSGFDDAWRIAAQWWPERTERVTGVSAADQRAAVHMLAGRSYILSGRGTEQHATGTDNVSAWINLALALGLPGRQGSGYGCLTGQGNGQGGREHGQKADQLPGYRKIDDPAARKHIMDVWGVSELPGPGRSAYELLTADDIKAMLVFGSNPVVSAPRASGVADRLRALDLLVVADFVMSETAAMADVVFPVTQWAEEDGTMTNLEGRVIRRRKALDPPPGVRSDLELINGLATRLGVDGFPTEPRVAFEELRKASKGGLADYSGITYERLDSEELHWPVPSTDHPGTPRLFLDRFAHPDGLARFIPVDHTGPAEPPDAEYPLQATTGRVLQHYQSGAQTRLIGELMAAVPEMYVEVHPDTAARAGLTPNEPAHVVSRRGRVTATVRCVPSMRIDAVFLPFHFPGDGRANLLTNPVLDPTSRMPEFKVCAVRLERACVES